MYLENTNIVTVSNLDVEESSTIVKIVRLNVAWASGGRMVLAEFYPYKSKALFRENDTLNRVRVDEVPSAIIQKNTTELVVNLLTDPDGVEHAAYELLKEYLMEVNPAWDETKLVISGAS